MEHIKRFGSVTRLWTLIAIGLAVILVPASMAEAKVKPKDGVYYQAATAKSASFGYVATTGGKVVGADFNIKFKDSKGKKCVPDAYTADAAGYIDVSFNTTKTKPNSKGKFKVKAKKSSYFPGLKGTVTGRFKSTKKAVFKASLKVGSCTAKRYYKRAVYTAGG